MEERPLSPEMTRLVEKVARWPHGLGFLSRGDLECVAVSLGVHPFVVAEAREKLRDEAGRAKLIREVRLERERLKAGGSANVEEEILPAEEPPARICEAEELIRVAWNHQLGSEFLINAPVETVAVTFEVHPRTVLRAREILEESRKRSPESDGT